MFHRRTKSCLQNFDLRLFVPCSTWGCPCMCQHVGCHTFDRLCHSRTHGVKVRCLINLICYVTPKKEVQRRNVRWMLRPACRFQPNVRDRKDLETSLLLNRCALGMMLLGDKRRLKFLQFYQKQFEQFSMKFLVRNRLYLPITHKTFIFGLSQNTSNNWIWTFQHPDPHVGATDFPNSMAWCVVRQRNPIKDFVFSILQYVPKECGCSFRSSGLMECSIYWFCTSRVSSV